MDNRNSSLVTIFGGDGFVGTQLVQELARKKIRIRVAVRRPDLAGHVVPLGEVGQILPIQANVRDMPSVTRAVEGADIVINLVGLKSEAGRQTFEAVHVGGAENVALAAKKAGVNNLVHMSVLGADMDAESASSRSRAEGEKAVLSAFAGAMIMRPSLIFGKDDGFFNLFGALSRLTPILPVICGKTLFQPVYVGDVAKAISIAATGGAKRGAIYELGGPDVENMRDLMERVTVLSERNNILLPMPQWAAKFMAFFLQILPSPILTVDQVTQLGVDNVVSKSAKKAKNDLFSFGIAPTTMDAVLPTYMWRFRRHGQFENQEA